MGNNMFFTKKANGFHMIRIMLYVTILLFIVCSLSFICAAEAAGAVADAEAGAGSSGASGAGASEIEGSEASEIASFDVAPVAEIQDQTPARRTRAAGAAGTSGASTADAINTAEKMYYCGELYIFTDSMIKLNYEIASIALDMKDALQSGALTKNRSKLNTIIRKYNALSETYNSWVDVKTDLEYFIDTIGGRAVFTKSQLQAIYKRTLTVINGAEDMIGAAQEYYKSQAAGERRALNSAADSLISSAANAVNTIKPYEQAAIAAYRSMFDQFALQAGLKIEYKTWQNPETETA